jgi:hypothetical protein
MLTLYARLHCMIVFETFLITVEPGHNDIGLYDTSSITSDILWYQLNPAR